LTREREGYGTVKDCTGPYRMDTTETGLDEEIYNPQSWNYIG